METHSFSGLEKVMEVLSSNNGSLGQETPFEQIFPVLSSVYVPQSGVTDASQRPFEYEPGEHIGAE